MHTTGSYKGHATITLHDGDASKGFSFGFNKARLILENLQAIRDFADKNEPKGPKQRCIDAPCCGCCE